MKTVILARVSTARQEEEGLSLDNQLQTLREYAQKKELEVVQEFRFSESADRKIRKKFLEMVDYVKQHPEVKAIIAYRVDRITRNYRDAVAMDDLRLDCDKELHFVYDRLIIDKTTVGRDIVDWDLKVFLAKQYLNRLKEDAKNSALYKLRNNEWPQKAPYGYQNITQVDKKKWIIPDPFEAKVVEKMYEWYSSGSFSMLEVRNKIKEVFDLNFSKGYVDAILKNKFYNSIMVYDDKEYPHNYEPIMASDLFEKVQQIKAGYNKKHFKFAGLPYVYRGLLKCKTCGCMITPEKKKGKYVYYHCTQYHGKHENAKWVTEDNLTNQFKQYFRGFEMPQEAVDDITQSIREAHKDKSYFHRSLLDNYNSQYQKYEDMIERAYEDKLSGSITESYYNKKRDEFRTKQKSIQKNIGKLQIADEEYYITSDYILDLAKRAPELYESSEPIEKRQLLKFALQNLQLEGSLACYDEVKPFDTIRKYAMRQSWLRD
jgi:site-specific DNA recombinase